MLAFRAARQTIAWSLLSFLLSVQEEARAERVNPMSGMRFYVEKDNSAARAGASMQNRDPATAKAMWFLAAQPTGLWFGDWSGAIYNKMQATVQAADADGSQIVAVLYNVPSRDCGQHSQGGVQAAAYRRWIDGIAAGLGQHKAVIILEPDAIALTTCLSPSMLAERWQLLNYAVSALKDRTQALVYMDIGHSRWIAADDMVQRLRAIGIDKADGLAINTSNYQTTEDSIAYGERVLEAFPAKGLIIDTSRNGNGPTADNAWCNPRGRALGLKPQVAEGHPSVDAYFYVKRPGESDGACNGGPAAGTFWIDVARELVWNAKPSLSDQEP